MSLNSPNYREVIIFFVAGDSLIPPTVLLLLAMIYCIRLEKHLQCEKLLGLARGTTKKRGNKKSDESITPIRYNVNHMYWLFSRPIIIINFYWWGDDQSFYYTSILECAHIIMVICDELMFLIHAVLSTGTHSPSMRSNMHGPYW